MTLSRNGYDILSRMLYDLCPYLSLSFLLYYCGSLSSGLWVFSSEMQLCFTHSSEGRDLSAFGLWGNLWDCSNCESAEGVSPGKEGRLKQLLERSHTPERQDAPVYSCTILRYKMGCLDSHWVLPTTSHAQSKLFSILSNQHCGRSFCRDCSGLLRQDLYPANHHIFNQLLIASVYCCSVIHVTAGSEWDGQCVNYDIYFQ